MDPTVNVSAEGLEKQMWCVCILNLEIKYIHIASVDVCWSFCPGIGRYSAGPQIGMFNVQCSIVQMLLYRVDPPIIRPCQDCAPLIQC